MSIIPEFIFNKRSPIIVGVRIESGILKKGTPIVVPSQNFVCYLPLSAAHKFKIEIGRITSIEKEHKALEEAVAGDEVCIEIFLSEDKQQYMVGRHFNHEDQLVSHITRDSLNALKEWFPEVCSEPLIFKLLLRLKKLFNV